jgi:PAS domain S-box-containing protein
MTEAPSRWVELAWALLILLAATLVRWMLAPVLGSWAPHSTYIVAVAAISWRSGLLPGLLALVLGALLAAYLFAEPRAPLGAEDPEHMVPKIAFLVAGGLIVVMGHAQRVQRQRALVAAEEAASQREWLQAILAGIGDAVVVVDLKERIVLINPVAERLSGWAEGEAVGRPLDKVIRLLNEQTERTAERSIFDPLTQDSSEVPREPAILQSRDGRQVPVDARTTPVRDARGAVTGFAYVLRDETGRRLAERQLRESEERFRLMADTAPVMIWIAGTDGLCHYFNRPWLDFTGRSLEQEQGNGWSEGVHPDDLASCMTTYETSFKAHRPFQMEYRLRRHDGAFRWVLDRGIPRYDSHGAFDGYIGSCLDVTEQKEAEVSLRESDRRKSEFLATLAHELRNPLAPIRNVVEASRLTEGDAESWADAREVIERQVAQLVRLIDDLLDLSRIDRGKIELKRRRVTLGEIVHLAVETSRPAITAAHHELTVSLPEHPVVLNVDPARVSQVLSNLLNNAAKYTDPGGCVSLGARLQGNEVIVSIRDTGIGIPAEMLAGIFEPFHQVRGQRDRSQGGLGIGLTLVRSLVEMHGGSVSASSTGPGQGSEFTIRLPTVAPEVLPVGDRPAPPAHSAGAGVRRRILVADDNRDGAVTLGRLLRFLGHEVEIAHDGQAALLAVATFRPDVALLDIGMPILDGHEVARRLRSDPEQAGMLLVALTGWGRPEDHDRSRTAGFDHHLVKPVEVAELTRLLDPGCSSRAGASDPGGTDRLVATAEH